MGLQCLKSFLGEGGWGFLCFRKCYAFKCLYFVMVKVIFIYIKIEKTPNVNGFFMTSRREVGLLFKELLVLKVS